MNQRDCVGVQGVSNCVEKNGVVPERRNRVTGPRKEEGSTLWVLRGNWSVHEACEGWVYECQS